MTAKHWTMIILLAMWTSSMLYGQEDGQADENWSKGPLVGRTWYLPFSIYYQYPGYSARSGKQFEFQYRISQYYLSDFSATFATDYQNTPVDNPPEGYPPAMYVSRDFESYNAELGFSFRPFRQLALGIDLRLVSFFGGFLDPVISSFHNLFGFPNGGREYAPSSQVFVDIQNASGVQFTMDSAAVSIGDIDLSARYTFIEGGKLAMAAYGAFKVPTGRIESLSGSGYPDVALGIATDYRSGRHVSLFGHAGMTIPFDSFLPGATSKPNPFIVGMLGVEMTPVSAFSINVQLNLKSPSLEPLLEDDLHWIFTGINRLRLPQIGLLVGCIFDWRGTRWQFYVEEDPFTNAGVDVAFNLSFTRTVDWAGSGRASRLEAASGSAKLP
jgi:hypothetical protein